MPKPDDVYLFGFFLFIELISSAFVMDYNLKCTRVFKQRNLPTTRRYLTLTERSLSAFLSIFLFYVFINIMVGPVQATTTELMIEFQTQQAIGYITFFGGIFWASGDYTRKVKKKVDDLST